MMNVWRQRGAGAAQSDPGKPCFGERDQKEVIHFCTVFMGVDNGVDNGSPPRLLHGDGSLKVDNWVDNRVSLN